MPPRALRGGPAQDRRRPPGGRPPKPRRRRIGTSPRGLRGAGPAGVVFPAPEGGYLRLENFRKRVWEPASASAGLAPLRLHDMRHCCASLAIAAGADVKVLQRMLGHASAALTLDRYGHLLPGQAEAVAARIDTMARQARCAPVPLPSPQAT